VSNAGRDEDVASEYVVDSSDEEQAPKTASKTRDASQSRMQTRRSESIAASSSQAPSVGTRASRSRFDDRTSPPARRKSTRTSEPASRTSVASSRSEIAQSSPLKRQRVSRATPEVIELSSSDSRAASESPSLGGDPYSSSRVLSPLPPEPSSSAQRYSRSVSSASSDIVLLDSPPNVRNPVVSQSQDEIEELPNPTRPAPSRTYKRRARPRPRPRRISSSPEPVYNLFHATNSPTNPFLNSPFRARGSSRTQAYRARVVPRPSTSPTRAEPAPTPDPESEPTSESEPEPEPEPPQPIASGSTISRHNSLFSSPPPPAVSHSAVSVSSTSSIDELGRRSPTPAPTPALPSWSSPLRGQTPRALDTPPPQPRNTVTRVLRMECVLLPRASRAMREAMAQFDRVHKQVQSRSTNGSVVPVVPGKGMGKSVELYVKTGRVNFTVEIPRKKGRKAKSKAEGAGMGKGKGKGSYAAREEGRWESSSPVRDHPAEDDDFVDIEEANNDEFDPAAGLRNDVDLPPPNELVEPQTPLPKKRGRKPKQTPADDGLPFMPTDQPSPAHSSPVVTQSGDEDVPPAGPNAFVPISPIRIDHRAALPSTYKSIPRVVAETTDRYCHCCRGQKKGTLKMICANLVRRRRGRGASLRNEHECGSWWCQRCVLKHDMTFDPFQADFTCPMCNDICVCDKCRRRLGQPPVGKIRKPRRQTGVDSPGKDDAEAEVSEPEPEPTTLSLPSQPASPDHSESESESDDDDDEVASSSPESPVKGPGYAQEMRKRGPTTWHGSRVPPPLQGANAKGPAALRNVFVPRMSKEDQLAEKLRTFEADYAAGTDASLLGADYGMFDVDEDIGGPSREEEASEHNDVDLDEFLVTNELVEEEQGPESAIDEPIPQAPENRVVEISETLMSQPSEFDEDEALSQAILQLGQGESITLNDDILQGLDAGIQDAHRHFYHPPDFSDLNAKLDGLDAEHSLQMRFDSVPGIMLGTDADEPINLGDFHDPPVYPTSRSYLSEEPVLSLAPTDLIRPPASEAHTDFIQQHDAELGLEPDAEPGVEANVEEVPTLQGDPPSPGFEYEPHAELPFTPHPESVPEPYTVTRTRPEPRTEFEVDPGLDAEGEPDPEPEFTMITDPESAKSTVLETPSPQFGTDVGLDIVGLGGPYDLFDNRISPSCEESITSVSRAPGSSVTDDTFSGGSRILASEEKTGNPAGSTPTPASTSLTFVLPSPGKQAVLRESLRTRFFTRSVAKTTAEMEAKSRPTDEGRVTRSRRR
ncbi:hypothetical protein BDV93DRAFT_523524, partial [Ceratobasidium sp. AG-I]